MHRYLERLGEKTFTRDYLYKLYRDYNKIPYEVYLSLSGLIDSLGAYDVDSLKLKLSFTTTIRYNVPKIRKRVSKPEEKIPPEIEHIETIMPGVSRDKFVGKVLGRDVLEDIVASVLKDFGFKVDINRQVPTKIPGVSVEVDVWAKKEILPGHDFVVFVECKNWDKKIDRSVVDEIYGRVSNLQRVPDLKIIVAKELTEPARDVAKADGFVVIELKEKANTTNAAEIYDIIYNYLSRIFVTLAPTKIQKLLQVHDKLQEVLKTLGKVLTDLKEILQS